MEAAAAAAAPPAGAAGALVAPVAAAAAAAEARAPPAATRLSERLVLAALVFLLGCAGAGLAFFAMTLDPADFRLLVRFLAWFVALWVDCFFFFLVLHIYIDLMFAVAATAGAGEGLHAADPC